LPHLQRALQVCCFLTFRIHSSHDAGVGFQLKKRGSSDRPHHAYVPIARALTPLGCSHVDASNVLEQPQDHRALLTKQEQKRVKALKSRQERLVSTAESVREGVQDVLQSVLPPLLDKCYLSYAETQQAAAEARLQRFEDGETNWFRIRDTFVKLGFFPSESNVVSPMTPSTAVALATTPVFLTPSQQQPPSPQSQASSPTSSTPFFSWSLFRIRISL
jgi:hypothetical protein